MTALHKHIQEQQDATCTLCGVLEAIAILDNEGRGHGTAITALIGVAQKLADQINDNLDSNALPEGGGS